MKKSIRNAALAVGGVAILGAAWAGGSVHAGRVAADRIRALAAPANPGSAVSIAAVSHGTGLFGASGSFEVRFNEHCNAPGSTGPGAVKVEYTLSNLLLPGSTVRFEWKAVPTGEVGEMLVKLTEGALRAEGRGNVSWDGTVRSSASMPELVLGSGAQALRVSAGAGELSLAGQAFGLKWRTERIVGRGAGKAMELVNLGFEIDLKDRSRGLGSTVLSVERMGTGFGTAEGLRLSTEAVERGDRTDVTITPSLRAVELPGQKARDLSMQVALRDVHTASLETIQRIGTESCGYRRLKPEDRRNLRAAVRTALTGGLSLDITDVKGSIGDGSLEGFLRVELKKAAPAVALATAGTDPVAIDLANLLVSSGELTLKGDAMKPRQRAMAISMGVATEVPGGLKAAFEYGDGLLKANGRVFDAGPLQVALSGADRGLNAFLGVPAAAREAPKAEAGAPSDGAPAAAPPPRAAVNALPPNDANTTGPMQSPSPPNTVGPVNSLNVR
jgi:hypothetical protein